MINILLIGKAVFTFNIIVFMHDVLIINTSLKCLFFKVLKEYRKNLNVAPGKHATSTAVRKEHYILASCSSYRFYGKNELIRT